MYFSAWAYVLCLIARLEETFKLLLTYWFPLVKFSQPLKIGDAIVVTMFWTGLGWTKWMKSFTIVKKFKLYLLYNNYETSYTTYINHACSHRCLRSDGLRVVGNLSARVKLTCLTWWPHDHLTCRRRVSNPGRSGERRVS